MSRARRVPTVRLPRTRERFGSGVAVSALVHGGLVLALVAGAATSREAFRGVGGSGPAGGGGGGATVVRYIELSSVAADQSAAPQQQQAEHVPTVQLALPQPDLETVPEEATRLSLTGITRPVVEIAAGEGGAGRGRGRGSGSGGGSGSGQGSGIGAGTGPGAGGGGGAAFPPEPRFIIVPADRPASVRGMQFQVTFWVDAGGRVTKVEVEPAIGDAGYRRKFLEQMYQFQFNPARTADGTPVSGHVVIPITL